MDSLNLLSTLTIECEFQTYKITDESLLVCTLAQACVIWERSEFYCLKAVFIYLLVKLVRHLRCTVAHY